MMTQLKLNGEVIWYNRKRKNGLIRSDTGQDYIIIDYLEDISEGDRVEFRWKAGFLEGSKVAYLINKEA